MWGVDPKPPAESGESSRGPKDDVYVHTHTHTPSTSQPTPALLPSREHTASAAFSWSGRVGVWTRSAAAASPAPEREFGGKVGQRAAAAGPERGEGARAATLAEGGGTWAPGRERSRRGGSEEGGAGCDWRSAGAARDAQPAGSAGAGDSYLTWRCGPASGELAVARRVSVSCAPDARPRAPFRSWWGLESSAAEARLPAALGARRLQPGREQWSRSWCPGGGAGGRARVRRRGSPDRAPPALQYAAAAAAASASQASGSPSSIAPPGATACIDCSTAVVRPWDLRKVLGLRCFSSCGARSRPGKARSPQCAKHSLGPVRTLRPRFPAQPGSSARSGCSGCTGVPAPVRRHPLPRAPQRYPQERSELCAPARREGSLSHSHPALVPPPPPPSASCLLGLVVPKPQPGRNPERAELLYSLV